MTEKEFGKDVKLAIFKGKADDWRMWSAKFLSFAIFKEFDEMFLGKKKVPVDEKDSEYKRLKELNNYGFYCLNYAIECKICFNIIDSYRTDMLPKGDCSKAWKMC